MTEEQFTDGIQALKRAKKATNPYFWWFSGKGSDGEPVLLVGKKEGIIRKAGREARKDAKDKKFAFGRLRADEKGILNFALDDGAAKPKQVQRTFKTVIAKLPGFKRVKGMLQRAKIVVGTEFDEKFAATSEEGEVQGAKSTTDPKELRRNLQRVMDRAKANFVAAKERTGGTGDEYAALKAQQMKAGEALKAAEAAYKKQEGGTPVEDIQKLFRRAISAFDVLSDASLAVGVEDDTGVADDVVDVAALNVIWRDAFDVVQDQLNALALHLRNHEDPELREIADKGLSELGKGQRVRIQKALIEARSAQGEKLDAALVELGNAADDFRDYLESSRQVDVVDENPFGVTVSVRNTLMTALDRIGEAI